MLDYGHKVKLGAGELGMFLIRAKLARKHLKFIDLMPVFVPLATVQLVIHVRFLEYLYEMVVFQTIKHRVHHRLDAIIRPILGDEVGMQQEGRIIL